MVLTLFLAMQAASVAPTLPPLDDDRTIVVTATPEALDAALRRCVAGQCTPRQDVVASIRVAEVKFRKGHYFDARRTLESSIGRNRRFAKSEPIVVAALYEATTTIALHDGEQAVAKRASGDRLEILRDAFGSNDPRYLQAELDDIDLNARLGYPVEIAPRYAKLERDAQQAGQPVIATAAAMRQAALQHAYGNDSGAIRRLRSLERDPDQNATTRALSESMIAGFASDHGDAEALNGVASRFNASLPVGRSDRAPVLLWQPLPPEPADKSFVNAFNLVDTTVTNDVLATVRWVDIGFQIGTDGRVESAAVLRSSSGGEGWASAIVATIAARRYSATMVPADRRYRVERWSLTADYGTPTGSLIRRRLRRPHYVAIDITSPQRTRIEPAPAPSNASSAPSPAA